MNEEDSIGDVVRVDPARFGRAASSWPTAAAATRPARARATAGAEVIAAGSGYGRACLAATQAAADADIMVFMDGDGADDPASIAALVGPIQPGASTS